MNRPYNLREDEAAMTLLVKEGRTQKYVANLLGITQLTIGRTVQWFNELGNYYITPGQGRKRSKNARDKRCLMQLALRNKSSNQSLSRSERAVRKRISPGNIE